MVFSAKVHLGTRQIELVSPVARYIREFDKQLKHIADRLLNAQLALADQEKRLTELEKQLGDREGSSLRENS